MLRFLLKGMFRDKSHSLFPLITVSLGVCVTVLMVCWIEGIFGDMIGNTAKFQTGHVKVITREYANEMDIMPIEYSLVNSDEVTRNLAEIYPDYRWVQRINFGGVIDVPDENRETKEQGFFFGKALDLCSEDSFESELLNLENALQNGRLPKESDEILISVGLFDKLKLKLNDPVTLISNSMDGTMAMKNFTVVGNVLFGVEAIDRRALITDLEGARDLLYMEDCAGEILGLSKKDFFEKEETAIMKAEYNELYSDEHMKFSPLMITLRDQQGLASYLDMVDTYTGTFLFIFILIMSIVLWNSGLMKGIRKYGEFGVRLAIGESKGHLYRSLILESVVVGIVGTILGTAIGLLFSLYLQNVGVSFGDMIKNSTIMISSTVHARITAKAFYIGFIPGLLASVAGAMLAGRGIYKRQTSQLFKELEQ